MSSVLAEAAHLRIGLSLGLLALLAGAEAVWPRRTRTQPRLRRLPGNLGITLVDALAVRLAFPVVALDVALLAAQRGWGVLNLVALPGWVNLILALLALDLAIYAQHLVFHKVPVLWRLHRMHHADLDLDVTSGARFHPFEIMLSMLVKMAVVLALGAPPLAVLLFEIILNATALFNHSNLALPVGLDRLLRLLVVTPDMHRVHHSVLCAETNSNYGFNLPWWDRLFGTYRAQPKLGHMAMDIGLELFRAPGDSRLTALLMQPFHAPAASSADTE